MNLLKPFRKKMRSLGIQSSTPLLIAVSGGLDSIALLYLSINAGYNVAVAHVNFKLRAAESDGDQEFVKTECEKLNIPFYSKILIVDKTIDNVQVTARNLRYKWFQNLCEAHGFKFILTAHHQDDRIETFFINLLRGSGIKGLRSIPERNQNIIRPILQFSKKQLQAYAKKNTIAWREDASNKDTDYLRNKIRHGIAKDFSELSDIANQNLAKSMDFLTEADQYFENMAAVFIHELKLENQVFYIPEEKWNFLFGAKPLHKYVLEFFGFRPDQFDVLELFGESQSGRRIDGEEYTVYRDRSQFILAQIGNEVNVEIPIHYPEGEIETPINISWETSIAGIDFSKNNNAIAFLNPEKLKFPLALRKWQNGDKFIPLGMRGTKKISDFLTDQKLTIPQKNATYVLESGDEICWVVGMRIDDRYKCRENQKSTFVMQLNQPE